MHTLRKTILLSIVHTQSMRLACVRFFFCSAVFTVVSICICYRLQCCCCVGFCRLCFCCCCLSTLNYALSNILKPEIAVFAFELYYFSMPNSRHRQYYQPWSFFPCKIYLLFDELQTFRCMYDIFPNMCTKIHRPRKKPTKWMWTSFVLHKYYKLWVCISIGCASEYRTKHPFIIGSLHIHAQKHLVHPHSYNAAHITNANIGLT